MFPNLSGAESFTQTQGSPVIRKHIKAESGMAKAGTGAGVLLGWPPSHPAACLYWALNRNLSPPKKARGISQPTDHQGNYTTQENFWLVSSDNKAL